MRPRSGEVLAHHFLGSKEMKPGWWIAGIVAAIAVGGTLWYVRRFRGDEFGLFDSVEDESTPKFFEPYPSGDSDDEFDGLNFLF
jgi:hypothetical protein